MKVLKFGGSSIGNAENIEKTVEIVKSKIEKDSCVVVLSAMHGTTDALIEVGRSAEIGDESFREKIRAIAEKHLETIRALVSENAVADFVKAIFAELEKIRQYLRWNLGAHFGFAVREIYRGLQCQRRHPKLFAKRENGKQIFGGDAFKCDGC
jgi:aspartokinase